MSSDVRYINYLLAWVDIVRRGAGHFVLGAIGITVFSAVYVASNLGLNTSTTDMISAEVPFRQTYRAYKSAFPVLSDNIVVVISGDSAEAAEAAAGTLAERLEGETELFEFVYPPDAFFQRHGLLYLDPDALFDLIDQLAAAEPLLADLSADQSLRGLFGVLGLALSSRGQGELVAAELDPVLEAVAETVEAQIAGRPSELSWRGLIFGSTRDSARNHRFILARPHLDFTSLRPARQAMDRIRSLARAEAPTFGFGIQVRLTGGLALEDEELESALGGAQRAGLISLSLVCVLLVLGLRSIRLVVATVLTLLAGLVWTAGFATLAIGHLNLISVAFAVLFVGLGIDFGIHFALRYREARANGAGDHEALRRTVGDVGGSLSLCAVAAAIGFYSFLPTNFAGLAELGLISGTSMFIALFANLTLLPALLTIFPPREVRSRGDIFFGRFVLRYPRAVPGAALAIGIAALVVAPRAQFDFNPLNLKDPGTESVATFLDLMKDSDTAPYTIGIMTENLEQAAELADRVAELELVDRALTLSDYVPDRQPEKLAILSDAALFLVPVLRATEATETLGAGERRAALEVFRGELAGALSPIDAADDWPAARGLADSLDRFSIATGNTDEALGALESRLLRTFPGNLSLLREAFAARTIALADLPHQLRARALAADGRARVEVFPAEDVSDNVALRRFVEAVRGVAPDATGDPVIIVEAGKAVVGAVVEAAIIALLLISSLLAALLRKLSDILLVLLPLTLAAVLTLALSVVIDLPFNFANVIVLPLLLGLGVANGVHLVLRQRRADGHGAMRGSTPRAVLFSALTTIASFGSLAVSPHPGTASMGTLLMIGIGLTLISTLVVLPPLLMRRGAPAAAPESR